jgi:hypothetical protein
MVVDSPTSESEQAKATDPPELSPLWGLTLVLGEIAERLEHDRRKETREENDDHEENEPGAG